MREALTGLSIGILFWVTVIVGYTLAGFSYEDRRPELPNYSEFNRGFYSGHEAALHIVIRDCEMFGEFYLDQKRFKCEVPE